MKHAKKIIIASVTAITVAAGASAYAKRGGADHHVQMLDRISNKLDLDDNQSAALATLATSVTETRELMSGSDTSLRSEISTLVSAETFDQGKALSMINERAAALQAQAPELVAAAAVFFDSLNAEQKSQIQTFADKAERRRRRH